MAKQMSYTDPNTGAVFPSSTWIPVGIYIDASQPSVKIDFLGYKDQATAANVITTSLGMTNNPKKGSVGSKSYTLTPAQFQSFALAAPVGANTLDVISADCYTIAMTTLDTDSATPDPDHPGQFIKQSFFANATDVVLF